jgi:alkylation response protein AidB-like acyl-CoA dehydrogenase
MANLLVDERDHRFVLYEMLDAARLCKSPRYAEHTPETFDMVLDAAYKMALNRIWPTYQEGDHSGGARLVDGQALVPECFREPFEHFTRDGWLTVDVDFENGGQQMPQCVTLAAMEAFMAANPAFVFLAFGCTGAGRMVQNFGTDRQKKLYMEPLYEGRWGGTMCLTEPGAGSDVGAIRTTATALKDGRYKIRGNKIFITNGDQQFTPNILHPVLARIEGDPDGTRGISIFLVPKVRVKEDGSLGEPNDVITGNVEKKMGIKASPTCTLNFGDSDGCIGELLGEPCKGMRIMFQMMNEARIVVGLQGVAHASAAFLHAREYARERIQGSAIENMKDPSAPKVAILRHPDVRRMLLTMKGYAEGLRALALYASYCMDRHLTEEGEPAQTWHDRMDLLTPIVKAYSSDMGFRVCELAIQIYGGYGFIQEYPVEQFLRDCKIASIYEGANGIQAMDLLGRKIGMRGGQPFMALLAEIAGLAQRLQPGPLAGEAEIVALAGRELGDTAMHLLTSFQQGKVGHTLSNASPVLELMGDVLLGWLLLWQAEIAARKLEELAPGVTGEGLKTLCEKNADAAFYAGKVATARFFIRKVVSLSPAKAAAIRDADDSAVAVPEAAL